MGGIADATLPTGVWPVHDLLDWTEPAQLLSFELPLAMSDVQRVAVNRGGTWTC